MARAEAARPVRETAWCVAALVLASCVDLGGAPPDAGPLPDGSGLPEGGALDGGVVFDVAIAGLVFSPKEIEIPRGATVRWTNYDAVPHTVTEGSPDSVTPPVFESPYLSTLGVYELAFPQPGEWRYYCFTHPLIMKDCFVRVR